MKETTAKELVFFGKITAGFTHEMKNILAIIKESSGLMEDLLSLSKDAPFPHFDRFSHRVTVIQQQVQRGVELAARLNRFAHSTDERLARIDLNDLAEQLTKLSERFARLKDIGLSVRPAESSVVLITSPVELQMAVFTLLESCWNQLPAGSEIELSVERRGQDPCINICFTGEIADCSKLMQKIEATDAIKTVREILDPLGIEIMQENEMCGYGLAFVGAKE
ncbi:MAG: hypothetical protein RBS57_15005 [Desulforhabdus sp.]|jgi:signal transduction histidine kinase|nr:hypothetical protein [Desulforhabdus sp.]